MTHPEAIEIKVMYKSPDGDLDYKWDWACETNGTALDGETDWLDIDNSEVISSQVVTEPSGITKGDVDRSDSNTSVVAWFSGGTLNEDYDIPCKIVTSANRTDTRILRIKVRNL